MKHGWNKTYPHKINSAKSPGVFCVTTSNKRRIFLYTESVYDAYSKSRPALDESEFIISAFKDK